MKPVPGITPFSAPYWEAAKNERLVLPRCNRCGRFHHHPRPWCPHCWSSDLGWEEVSGRATVVTFCVVHQPPSPEFDVPYVLAVVELQEGPEMMTNIVDVSPAAVHIGMPVTVTFEHRGDLELPQFRPAP